MKKHGAKPQQYKKSLGQNFLQDPALLNAFVDAAGVGQDSDVLEIGTGLGSLTAVLSERCRKVLTVEIDDMLIPVLSVMFEKYPNIELVHGNIMRLDLHELLTDGSYHVVANIPYYLTNDLIGKLLLTGLSSLCSVNILVQKEAAEKIVARPGSKTYCPLSVFAQYYGSPSIALEVDRTYFTPVPNVDSAFVTVPLRPRASLPVAPEREKDFIRFIQASFAMRRKTLVNNLQAAYGIPRPEILESLSRTGLGSDVRAETLSVDAFVALFRECGRFIGAAGAGCAD